MRHVELRAKICHTVRREGVRSARVRYQAQPTQYVCYFDKVQNTHSEMLRITRDLQQAFDDHSAPGTWVVSYEADANLLSVVKRFK